MRRYAPLFFCLALVVAACSDSNDDPGAESLLSDTTAVVETTEAAPETTEAAPETTQAPEPASITPEVVCTIEADDTRTYFAYVNDSSEPVAITADQSVLDGVTEDDIPFVPNVFAPGRVSPAFFAYGAELSWTIVSPDGTSQTAPSGAVTPECTDELLTPTTDDPRAGELEITDVSLADDGVSVTIEAVVTGIPELSVCHPAFTPEPASIVLEDVVSGATTEGTSATFTADIAENAVTIDPAARFSVRTIVVDRCTGDGVTQSSWPTGALEDLWECTKVQASVVDGELTVESFSSPNCSDLAITGGARSRPN